MMRLPRRKRTQLWPHLDELVHVSGAGHTDELGRHILHPAPHCLQHLRTASGSPVTPAVICGAGSAQSHDQHHTMTLCREPYRAKGAGAQLHLGPIVMLADDDIGRLQSPALQGLHFNVTAGSWRTMLASVQDIRKPVQ